jgi:two-component system, chemotaxis family, protein-glutamate methylesterase/glutaminase
MERALVVIGTSAGGLRALETLLGGMSGGFPLPIVIAQHRSADSAGLAGVLQASTRLRVVEAEDKMMLEKGAVYVAPPDYHLLVEQGALALSTDEPVRFSRPSIDVLFESAAAAYGSGVVCVVLTGANEDGCRGARQVADAGGYVVVQHPETAESPTMPAATLRGVPSACVLQLGAIGGQLARLAEDPNAPCGGVA